MRSIRSNVYRNVRTRVLHRFRGSTYPFGFDFGGWLSLLRENNFAVDHEYWPKAMLATVVSIRNSAQRAREEKLYSSAVTATKIEPPLFVLGHARSGTTHLLRLLTLDDRFAYPTLYETFQPHTFLTARARDLKLAEFLLPKTRPMDNMTQSLHVPEEDEWAFLFLTRYSPYAAFMFPRNWDRYQGYLTLREVPDAEREQWKAAFTCFLKKLTWKYPGRQLILKSPTHTARVRVLLDMFPDAKFLHIHRDPYTVFQSTQKLFLSGLARSQLQRDDRSHLAERIIKQYNDMYEAFFQDRTLVPSQRFHEVRFEDLERDPVGQLDTIYQHLNLDGFEQLEPKLHAYLDSVRGYRRNVYPELGPALRQRIADCWARSFETWSYPV